MSSLHAQYLLDLLARGQRHDGRELHQLRPVSVELGIAPKAEGSARVKLGSTDVIAGVKLGLGAPFPDRPEEGVLVVNAELSPIASPLFELGPPRENAIELARVVDRGIREGHAIALDKLCITPKEQVWTVSIDLAILNHDGNLIDACGLAALAALAHASLPALKKDGTINYEKRERPLPLMALPVPVTVVKLGGKLAVDPTLEEEDVARARLTVTTTEDGKICALQKGGSEPFTEAEIDSVFALALAKAGELRPLATVNRKK